MITFNRTSVWGSLNVPLQKEYLFLNCCDSTLISDKKVVLYVNTIVAGKCLHHIIPIQYYVLYTGFCVCVRFTKHSIQLVFKYVQSNTVLTFWSPAFVQWWLVNIFISLWITCCWCVYQVYFFGFISTPFSIDLRNKTYSYIHAFCSTIYAYFLHNRLSYFDF